MRVVLDAFWWAKGTQSLQNVVHGIVETWSRDFPDDELVLVVRRKHRGELGDLPANAEVRFTRLWPQALVAMFAVPWNAVRRHADGMLSHNFGPMFGPRRGVLIQDLIFETNPEWFTRKELVYYRWMRRSARHADVVFSTTETEAARIARYAHVEHVVPVGLGAGDELRAATDEPVAALEPGKFLLVVGRLNARKNLANTLEGARRAEVLTPEFPIVIVGERDGAAAELPAWVAEGMADGSVRFPGFVSTGQLRWLIRHCAFYACLSLDEGFGLPPVEARMLGADVLASDRPVFRETLGEHATFVDPLDPAAIGAAMKALAHGTTTSTDPDRARDDLVARNNWSRTVAAIRERLLAAGTGSRP